MVIQRIITEDFTKLPTASAYWDFFRVANISKNLKVKEHNGRKALLMSVRPGDKTEVGDDNNITERTELGESGKYNLIFGTKVIYEFEFSFPNNFRITNNRLVFAQWKHTNSNKSPLLSLRYIDGKFLLVIRNDNEVIKFPQILSSSSAWHKFKVELEINKRTSTINVELDDIAIVKYIGNAGFKGEEERTIFKLGLYRDAVNWTDEMFFSNFKRIIL